ncbi:hypothetical protein, partial [Sphingobacterium kitahiroshimense]
ARADGIAVTGGRVGRCLFLYRSLCYTAEAFLCLYLFYAVNRAVPVLSVTSAGPSCSSFTLFSFYILFLSDKHTVTISSDL